jgi:hypothetical protein
MTIQEKLAIGVKSHELWVAGKEEEATVLRRTIPLAPHLAKIAKEKIGVDFLINGGWNLAEAEAKFGKDWLTR